MSKRRRQGAENLCSSCKRSLCRKHLYLVLDDWNKGFTIHKIDADSFHATCHSAGDEVAVAGYLTDPPAVRLQTPGDDAHMFFTAVGNKILIVTDRHYGQTPALMYDTGTAGLAFGPRVPAHPRRGLDMVVAAGDALYGFSPPHCNMLGSFEVMSWKLTALDLVRYDTRYSSEEPLSWKSLPGPHPEFHKYEVITSYAVHPDEHTIFMTTSCMCMYCQNMQKSTYSFNTQRCVWKWHAWLLPFEGPGFFDRELDAWVGLRTEGHICSCRVPTDRGSATPVKQLGLPELDCYQITRNKLFRRDPEKHLGASLTHMGARKFCLVETVIDRGVSEEDYYSSAASGCELHITIFDLRYNHKGELQTARNRSIRSYKLLAKHDQAFAPIAFWM